MTIARAHRGPGAVVTVDPRLENLLAQDLIEDGPRLPEPPRLDPRTFRLMAIGNLDDEELVSSVEMLAVAA